MKERPILFSGPMVRAILEGRKTQTRRVVVPSPGNQRNWLTPDSIAAVPHGAIINGGWQMHHPRAGTRFAGVDVAHDSPLGWIKCPYGAPGDTLWVRETFSFLESNPRGLDLDSVWYWADGPVPGGDWTRPKPSIHMPRWASRLSLRIKSVRVERLQEISEADARAEGMYFQAGVEREPSGRGEPWDARDFAALWDYINAKSHPWASNPWVWVVEFERETKEQQP